MKVGRNAPCPCGSGRKFKRCHGSPDADRQTDTPNQPDAARLTDILAAQKSAESLRKTQQGLGKPIIAEHWKGYRFVAVKDKLYYSTEWKTFHDFLGEYIILLFSRSWFFEQSKLPMNDQHIMLKWAEQTKHLRKSCTATHDKIFNVEPTGGVFALLSLSYNLYIISHNAELQERLIERLKRPDAFWGAVHETYVCSYFLRAGFEIHFEDETDGSDTHCEFVAEHSGSGAKFSVEAKTREKEILQAQPETPDKQSFGVRNRLYKALRKSANHTRVIFIELATRTVGEKARITDVIDQVLIEVAEAENTLKIRDQEPDRAYLFFTNCTFHLAQEEPHSGTVAFAGGFHISNFGANAELGSLRDYQNSKDQHFEMCDLMKSMQRHSRIPSTFDGDYPEFSFNPELANQRLLVGKIIRCQNDEGEEVQGKLEHAIVIEKEKIALCLLSSGQKRQIVKIPLSEEELRAYKHDPIHFFGKEIQVNQRAENIFELFDFFFETYSKSPKHKLLEFMSGDPNIAHYKNLSQRELAIIYCEKCALAAEQNYKN